MPTYLDIICKNCGKHFQREQKDHSTSKRRMAKNYFCSQKCTAKFNNPPVFVHCTQCKKTFKKLPSQIKRSKNHFCSRSCAATYNNLHKTTGTRRSKLEVWIEEQLTALYPDLDIEFNKKDAINSELDIYIPSLSLAFEMNGIYHYEPIHGQGKFDQIQNNDHRKFAACLERNIELCIIDTSLQNYFKEKTSQKYLDIITSILNLKLSSVIQPALPVSDQRHGEAD